MSVILAKWTLDDYHRLVASGVLDDCQVELLSGEIVEMPPEGEPHAYFNTSTRDYLIGLLGDPLRVTRRDRVTVREAKPITLPDSRSEPEPDLAIVQPLGREYLTHHPHPENIFWLIEFSNSSLTKDTEVKRKTYAQANISEYWVVNLKTMELIVYREPFDGNYASQTTQVEGEIRPVRFPDVVVSVKRLLN
ncbi:Uma2 family endonuclease [Phormidesmis sp. 146-35]